MRRRIALAVFALVLVVPALPALAHEAPEGSEWVMADWMFLSFGIFAGVAFIAFLVAFKRGMLSNLEAAKYYVLTIDEEDYYTPEWAMEDEPEGDSNGN